MAKYLIINADDYGLCKASNDAVEDLFRNGFLNTATVMIPCRGARDAVNFSIENPQYAIGIHLTLTNEWKSYHWAPLTDGKSLRNKEGYMWKESDEVEKHVKYSEFEAELRAQIDLAHSWGMKPSHLDNHMGSTYGHYTGRFGLLKRTLKICGDYGYSFRMFSKADKRVCPKGVPNFAMVFLASIARRWEKKYNVITPDYLLFPEWTKDLRQSYEHYREEILKIWTNIPDGVTETFLHPALETDEIKSITSMWQCRVWEYEIMKDPYALDYLTKHGVTLINHRDLRKMREQ